MSTLRTTAKSADHYPSRRRRKEKKIEKESLHIFSSHLTASAGRRKEEGRKETRRICTGWQKHFPPNFKLMSVRPCCKPSFSVQNRRKNATPTCLTSLKLDSSTLARSAPGMKTPFRFPASSQSGQLGRTHLSGHFLKGTHERTSPTVYGCFGWSILQGRHIIKTI